MTQAGFEGLATCAGTPSKRAESASLEAELEALLEDVFRATGCRDMAPEE